MHGLHAQAAIEERQGDYFVQQHEEPTVDNEHDSSVTRRLADHVGSASRAADRRTHGVLRQVARPPLVCFLLRGGRGSLGRSVCVAVARITRIDVDVGPVPVVA